jgi:hypothetical protein
VHPFVHVGLAKLCYMIQQCVQIIMKSRVSICLLERCCTGFPLVCSQSVSQSVSQPCDVYKKSKNLLSFHVSVL